MSDDDPTSDGRGNQADCDPTFTKPRVIPASWRDMHLLAVAPRYKMAGINPPGYTRKPPKGEQSAGPQTYDWRYPSYSEQNTAGVYVRCKVRPIRTALETRWYTEAMAVRYLVRDEATGLYLAEPPRVNKPGLEWLESQGYTVWLTTLVVDVDTPGHRDWIDEDESTWLDMLERNHASLSRAILYKTGRGFRIQQRLSRPVPIRQAEEVIAGHVNYLLIGGVATDPKCNSWPHVMRMPDTWHGKHQRRNSFPVLYRDEAPVDPDEFLEYFRPKASKTARKPSMKAKAREEQARQLKYIKEHPEATNLLDDTIDIPAYVRDAPGTTGYQPLVARCEIPKQFADALPTWWQARALAVGAVIDKMPASAFSQHGYRHMYLTLGGVLCFAGEPLELVPEFVRQVAVAARSVKPGEHGDWARDTVIKYAQGVHVTGFPALLACWPDVARAYRHARNLGRTAETLAGLDPPRPLAEVRRELMEKLTGFAMAEPGPVLVDATAGLGKTTLARHVAHQLSFAGRRSALSFDKHALVLQQIRSVADLFPIRRFRSTTSQKEVDGSWSCHKHAAAVEMQRGGLSVSYECCEGRRRVPCEFHPERGRTGGCTAFGPFTDIGARGETPSVAFGVHDLIAPMVKHVGGDGWICLDESPSVLRVETIGADGVGFALARAHLFVPRFAAAMRPALLALQAWIVKRGEEADENSPWQRFPEAVREGCDDVDAGDLRDAVVAAAQVLDPLLSLANAQSILVRFETVLALACQAVGDEDGKPHHGPPLRNRIAVQARDATDVGMARDIGRASHVYHVAYEALAKRHFVAEEAAPDAERRVDPELLVPFITPGFVTAHEGALHARRGAIATIAMPRRTYLETLFRTGPTAILDANIDLVRPVVQRLHGFTHGEMARRTLRARARDAGVVERVRWNLRSANRSSWFVNGLPVWSSGLLMSLWLAIRWAQNAPAEHADVLKAPLYFVSYKPLIVAMKATLHPEDAAHAEAWKEMGLPGPALDEARKRLRPVLATWTGEWLLAHYNGLRGLNDGTRARTIITFGDPWTNRTVVAAEALWMGLDVDLLWQMRCEAEVDQALNRLRPVTRTEYLRMLLVGTVLPADRSFEENDVTEHDTPPLPDGLVTSAILGDVMERTGWSQGELAAKIGVSKSTVTRWILGTRMITTASYFLLCELLKEL